MPTYDYHCKDCGHGFTAIKRIAERNDPEDVPCEECGKLSVAQKIGAPLISYQVGGILSKTDNGWKEVQQKIKSGSGRGNTINVK